MNNKVTGMYKQNRPYLVDNVFNTLRFLLSVCLSVCDGCGRGRNEIAGRVQNLSRDTSCICLLLLFRYILDSSTIHCIIILAAVNCSPTFTTLYVS